MKPRRTKYDTNPLDEKVGERSDAEWGKDTATQAGAPTQNMGGAPTRDIGRAGNNAARVNPETEAPTRRIDESYPSVFAYGHSRAATYAPPRVPNADLYQPPPVPPPQVYQSPPSPVATKPGSRKVKGLGIPEKWALILPYFPFGFVIAIVAAILELVLVPRTETRVRFHAAQGLVLQIGITVISTLFGFVDLFAGRFTGSSLFSVATIVFLIISMVRVWQGKPHHIAIIDPVTKWVDEKMNPRK